MLMCMCVCVCVEGRGGSVCSVDLWDVLFQPVQLPYIYMVWGCSAYCTDWRPTGTGVCLVRGREVLVFATKNIVGSDLESDRTSPGPQQRRCEAHRHRCSTKQTFTSLQYFFCVARH